MKFRKIIWKSLAHEGIEELCLVDKGSGFMQGGSTLLIVDERGGYESGYYFDLMENYSKQKISIWDPDHPYVMLDITRWNGNWSLGLSWKDPFRDMKEFEDCTDIDISATPFTNMLPIRRIDWTVGQSEDFKMLYVSIPDLTLSVSRQRYTCLEKTADGALFRFELIDGDFEAEISVDGDGLVIDYPGLFKRLWTSDWVDLPR